ncbi:MAG: bifunctional diaminohydroxyphosphoribosylaminopyrimidine deaminase/5-amino-6-(5-phosphoribosylamino)uracil reductase RibD [Desulfovibrionaceae bacterium]
MSTCPLTADAAAFMAHALRLALRGKGATAPNPCVGAVLVRGGAVVAEGWHTAYGKSHAEVECLADAARKGVDPAACDMYVTLEPCNHHGKTPPCSRAVLAAGVRRVVVGCVDPNPDVAGGGAAFLRGNGVTVEVLDASDPMAVACADLIADFLLWKRGARTYNYLKLASTLDGRIATRTGHSQWISCEASRRAVHALRGRVQAVVVGGGTFYADNPALTCRLEAPGEAKRAADAQPLAVVVTSRLPQPDADFTLLRQRAGQTIFWTTEVAARTPRATELAALGCRVWALPPASAAPGQAGGLDLAVGFERLRREADCLYTLCEGGGVLGLALIRAGLADEFLLHLAPKIVGDDAARPLFAGLAPQTMDEALGLRVAACERSGDDLAITFRPKAD